MTFEEYLTKRRVNVAAFATGEPARFAEWQAWYSQMHPESFYLMVKMILNDVRRKFWLAEVPKPVAAAAETAAPARPAGRRAAIAKPATAANPEAQTSEISVETSAQPASEISEIKPAENFSTETTEAAAAKPARPVFKPRAVIKKPTPEVSGEISETDKPAETTTEAKPEEIKASDETKPISEIPEDAPAKPARPRAVIKRPAALSKPENDITKASANPASETTEAVGGTTGKVVAENAAEAPKPARPRPVFKRPAVSEPKATEPEKTVGETPQKPEANSETATENPVAKPGQEGASEAKAVAEEIQQSPEAAKAAEEVAAEAGHVPKPPRPRPIFKRPAAPKPPENEAAEPEKTVAIPEEKPVANAAENPAETVENSGEKPEAKTVGNPEEKAENVAPKPPRPRPVFKRPSKPGGDSEKLQ